MVRAALEGPTPSAFPSAAALESRAPGVPPASEFERNFLRLLFFAWCITACPAFAADPAQPPAKAPASIELRDQYDALQRLTFPATNVVVLTIADKKGSEQIDGWVAALKARYAGRLDIRGLADVGGVPVAWRGKMRKKFQETRRHPVMMDWSGTNCARFGFQPGVANVLVIERDGTIGARLTGPVRDAALREAFAAADIALVGIDAPSAKAASNPKDSFRP
jgi:hypothetical protein